MTPICRWTGCKLDAEYPKIEGHPGACIPKWCGKHSVEVFKERHAVPQPDLVNHPPHYTQGGIECIEAIEAMTANPAWAPGTAYRLGNVLKYLWRHADKDPVGSLKKARWYLDREIATREKAQ